MSDTAIALQPSTPEHSAATRNPSVLRTPCYWMSAGEPILGWLHTAKDHRQCDHAVVIAPPIGYEQLHSHRSLRHLADALASEGIPTFRFDWHGTGDSAGRDEDPCRLETWRTNLRDAVEFLKSQVGISRISVIGLRLGATIAAAALSEADIDSLVLWAPVVSGRTYVREMTAIDRTSEIPSVILPGTPADLEPAGLVLSEATAAEIAAINLLNSPPPSCPTLIVSREDFPTDRRLLDAYAAAGMPVDHISSSDYAGMMADPHKGSVPDQTIQAITGWFTQRLSTIQDRDFEWDGEFLADQYAVFDSQPEGLNPPAATPVRESLRSISPSPELFGILTEPASDVCPDLPTIVILNAGCAYRAGPGRLNVHLARSLAAAGFRCLRFDANGLGDSIADERRLENQTYSATIFRDVDLVMDFLSRNNLGQKFVLLGLCSGAYFSFQTAVSSSNPALEESILINPLTYFWRDGMVISESTDRQLLVQQYYFESALDPHKWLKLFSGKTRIGWRGAWRLLLQRFGSIRNRNNRWVRQPDAVNRPPFSHPVEDNLADDLAETIARKRHLLMIFGESDPGYHILQGKAARMANSLRRQGQLEIEFIPDTDHNFSRRSARLALAHLVATHLRQRYPAHSAH